MESSRMEGCRVSHQRLQRHPEGGGRCAWQLQAEVPAALRVQEPAVLRLADGLSASDDLSGGRIEILMCAEAVLCSLQGRCATSALSLWCLAACVRHTSRLRMTLKPDARSHLCSIPSAVLASATLATHERSSLLTVAFPQQFDGNIILVEHRLDLSRFYESCDGLHWYAGSRLWRCMTGTVAKLQRWQPNLRSDCNAIMSNGGNLLLRTGGVMRSACRCFALAVELPASDGVVLVNRDDASRMFVTGYGHLIDALQLADDWIL
eukprot:4105666-Lingulodinium_polyedra.AAC.1